jgi:hypothetical protein
VGITEFEDVLLGFEVVVDLLVQFAPSREVRGGREVVLVGDFVE